MHKRPFYCQGVGREETLLFQSNKEAFSSCLRKPWMKPQRIPARIKAYTWFASHSLSSHPLKTTLEALGGAKFLLPGCTPVFSQSLLFHISLGKTKEVKASVAGREWAAPHTHLLFPDWYFWLREAVRGLTLSRELFEIGYQMLVFPT